ncbi:hypothetical protein CO058_00870 [candidate division WWE3 bacterium CG_4_9_14_0_2_um_filter_35_11]|uniref:Polymerase/histidinol phosphatase N-terminal domain-containing protein n=1 Tax=candidate division WWE3 bacterium CG_4_9_14_0_2_um_filter_35_11 TaxID=1975077 RepID=A0A2M8EMP1_UNCKA|nr:MAG: hypothetical protein COV25_00650 [candidate division WWE3 bacterium CG10_big_fil_rev_8_21_14_0_10_35_32]PJC23947.1 MAG: hypothetical protein CO058_00870 [candidate division WWE3 bacterium CG_4_9_14_0_2_um_filter_35_11]
MKNSYITDLHGHSYYSDGKCSPKEIANIAFEIGIDVVALTDHDLTFGIDEFENKIAELNKDGKKIIGIPGIEVTTEEGHIIFLFDNPKDAKEFSETIHIEEKNNLKTVIKNAEKYNKYIIIPHVEIPFIGSFSFESVEKFFKNFPNEMLHTGLEAINGESQVMPKFLLKKHYTLKEKNTEHGWNRNLFGNSDHHSKHGIGVGVTEIQSEKEIKNAKDFIELLKTSKGGEAKIQKILSTTELLTEYFYIISGTIRKRVALILSGLPFLS